MRSSYPHLPNPTVFVAKNHTRKNYLQKLFAEPGMKTALIVMAVWVLGFAASASLH